MKLVTKEELEIFEEKIKKSATKELNDKLENAESAKEKLKGRNIHSKIVDIKLYSLLYRK